MSDVMQADEFTPKSLVHTFHPEQSAGVWWCASMLPLSHSEIDFPATEEISELDKVKECVDLLGGQISMLNLVVGAIQHRLGLDNQESLPLVFVPDKTDSLADCETRIERRLKEPDISNPFATQRDALKSLLREFTAVIDQADHPEGFINCHSELRRLCSVSGHSIDVLKHIAGIDLAAKVAS